MNKFSDIQKRMTVGLRKDYLCEPNVISTFFRMNDSTNNQLYTG